MTQPGRSRELKTLVLVTGSSVGGAGSERAGVSATAEIVPLWGPRRCGASAGRPVGWSVCSDNPCRRSGQARFPLLLGPEGLARPLWQRVARPRG